MQLHRTFARFALIGVLALATAGCVATGDRRTNNTLLGAGLGAAAGGVMSDGDPLYMIGGAAAGGILGNILTPDRGGRGGRGWDRRSDRGHSHRSQRHYRNYR